ncbi:MAG: phosphatase PAP2 family protein [Bdellovibrionia bacterium]
MKKLMVITSLVQGSLSLNVAVGADYPKPVYLPTQAIDLSQALSPPPRPGSKADQEDFKVILRYQTVRTEAECRRANHVVDVALSTLFGPEYGPLSEEEVRRWSAFFEKVRIDAEYFVQESKKMWGRPRPFSVNADIKPCVAPESTHFTNAYPSGHAAIARTFASLLSQIDPARKAAFMARADEIGTDRVLAGVHHPTDIESGKRLGDRIFQVLMKNANFKRELQLLLKKGGSL